MWFCLWCYFCLRKPCFGNNWDSFFLCNPKHVSRNNFSLELTIFAYSQKKIIDRKVIYPNIALKWAKDYSPKKIIFVWTVPQSSKYVIFILSDQLVSVFKSSLLFLTLWGCKINSFCFVWSKSSLTLTMLGQYMIMSSSEGAKFLK